MSVYRGTLSLQYRLQILVDADLSTTRIGVLNSFQHSIKLRAAIYPAIQDHGVDCPGVVDIAQWVLAEQNQIGTSTYCNNSGIALHQLSRVLSGSSECLGWAHASHIK